MPGKPYQSKLEPYAAEILQRRRNGETYRAIAAWITAQGTACTHNAVHSFVKAKSRRQQYRTRFADGLDDDLRTALMQQIVAVWTHDSTAIEGNTLTLGETVQVLEFGLTIDGKPLKDHQEVYGHARAIDQIHRLVDAGKVTIDDVLELHKSVMPLSPVDSQRPIGSWKTDYNGTTGVIDGQMLYKEYAAPHHVPALMEQWLARFNDDLRTTNRRNCLEKYCWAHAGFVRIHPFFDGNGRMARLLANVPVLLSGQAPVVIANQHRRAYIEHLWRYQFKLPDVAPGTELVPENDAYRRFADFVKSESSAVRKLITDAREKQKRRDNSRQPE